LLDRRPWRSRRMHRLLDVNTEIPRPSVGVGEPSCRRCSTGWSRHAVRRALRGPLHAGMVSTTTLVSPPQTWARWATTRGSDNGAHSGRDVYWSLGQLVDMNTKRSRAALGSPRRRDDPQGVGLAGADRSCTGDHRQGSDRPVTHPVRTTIRRTTRIRRSSDCLGQRDRCCSSGRMAPVDAGYLAVGTRSTMGTERSG